MTNPSPTHIVESLWAAMAPVLADTAQAVRQLHTALRPLIEYAEQHPEAIEQWKREQEAEARAGTCHCLCAATHDRTAPGVCCGTAEPGLEIIYRGTSVGPQAVAHCRPCWTAKRGGRR